MGSTLDFIMHSSKRLADESLVESFDKKTTPICKLYLCMGVLDKPI